MRSLGTARVRSESEGFYRARTQEDKSEELGGFIILTMLTCYSFFPFMAKRGAADGFVAACARNAPAAIVWFKK